MRSAYIQFKRKSSRRKRSGRKSGSSIWSGLRRRRLLMANELEKTRRRHVREKSVIDHVARDLFKPPPEPAAQKSDKPKPTTDTGLPIEEQVRKEWARVRAGCRRF